MAKAKVRKLLERKELEAKARDLIATQGNSGILVQLFVMFANDLKHLDRAVGEIRGVLVVLVPLTVAVLAFTALSLFK